MEMTDEQRRMVEENIKLVYYVVHKLNPPPQEYEDFLQEGLLGLCVACVRFDPSKNFEFSTYAYPYIEGYVKKFRGDNSCLPAPRSMRDLYCRVQSYKRLHGEDCDEKEMLSNLDISEEMYLNMLSYKSIISLDIQIETSEDTVTLMDMIPDTAFEEKIRSKEDRGYLLNVMEQVLTNYPDRTQRVYRDYFYSILEGVKTCQKTIGEKYGYSQCNVARIIKKINKKIQLRYLRDQ